MNYQDPELREALAAEYVLGTLRGPARRRFERLLQADYALRRAVERWQSDLYPTLVEALPERAPPPRVWDKIAAHTAAVAALEDQPEPVRRRDNVVVWRSWGALAAAAALALAVYAALNVGRWTSSPPIDVVAVLNDANAQPAWAVRLDRDTRRLHVQVLHEQTLAPERSFELWLLPGADQAPIPLGLIQARGATALDLSADLLARLPTSQALAVSLEPEGGSPTGLPTGPVLYQGALLPPA